MDEIQYNYCVITFFNLILLGGIRLLLFEPCYSGNILNRKSLGVFCFCDLISHCNPMSKCPSRRLASLLFEFRAVCEHFHCGCRFGDLSRGCQWECAAIGGCWLIHISSFGNS